MVEMINGIGSDSGAGDSDFPKGDVAVEAPSDGQVDTGTDQQERAEPAGTPNADDEFRAELEKRFGSGKSEQELLQEVFKSYRNMEIPYSQASEKIKELEDLTNKFGGVDALRNALNAPQPAKPVENRLPDNIQKLIDTGYLDPNDPKDALIIDQEIRLEQSKQAIVSSTYDKAVQTFESGLADVAKKYEFADMDVIKELGYKGAFANMSDQQMWQAIDTLANKQHSKVAGLVDSKTQEKLDALKNLNAKKPLDGQPGGGKPLKRSPAQAFDDEYNKHFN